MTEISTLKETLDLSFAQSTSTSDENAYGDSLLYDSPSTTEELDIQPKSRLSLLVYAASMVRTVFSVSFVLSGVGLFLLRLFQGKHAQGEEIIVLATPIIIGVISSRLLRITIAPLSRDEETKVSVYVTFHDVLTWLFGLGVVLLLLVLSSLAVYSYFGIHWAVSAAMIKAKAICAILVLLATVMLFKVRRTAQP